MNYQEIHPPEHLRNHIRYCWTLESEHAENSTTPFRTMADGCPGLIYQPKSEGTLYQGNKQLSDLFLFGQSTRYAELQLTGNFQAIGIHFYPNALKTLFGLPAEELTNSCLNLEDLVKKKHPALSDQLLYAPSANDQLKILFYFLDMEQKSSLHLQDAAMKQALAQIIQSKGLVPLKSLQDDLGLSERSMERKFKAYTGISPKLFSRICRFQASLIQLRNNEYDKFSDIAYENNYADQSHFIRSFKEFAGFSPFQYQKKSFEIVENLNQLRPS
ncbi:AraC family transcriptional regulator [Pedobacter sp. HMWF019]|uniref:helix-turn-helix transcriptional regulator n=1 Tax=Pedobacter sp. HMWF019 TaxID=2056856 RepID=UPI000D3765DE|nr:helix-turn-helix transcriptional regulator [Pedobacter sp. HMWF019]PTT01352.1 AraC family transcriptional regulator [Pedobacter sp. HMWF019]